MTETYSIYPGIDKRYVYYKESFPLIYKDSFDQLLINDTHHGNEELFFLSDNKKIIANLSESYYHFICDVLPIIQDISANNEIEIIFYTKNKVYQESNNKSVFDAVFKILDNRKIKYTVLNLKDGDILFVNNFFIYNIQADFFNENDIKNIFDFFNINNNYNADKKVYVSRKYHKEYDSNFFLRIDNEHILEEYLSSIGFEIVCPEDFTSFEEQILYFQKVKTIASVTSSGLTNQIFMPKGGNVVEFICDMNFSHFEEQNRSSIHHFYSVLAYHKSHNYLGIPNNYKNSIFLIDQLKKIEYL